MKKKEIKNVYSGPDVQDVVRNKISNVSGTMIARYPGGFANTKWFCDVRIETGISDRDIWYHSPVENWELVRENEDGGV